MADRTRRNLLAATVGSAVCIAGLTARRHAFAQDAADDPSATLTALLSRYVSAHADGVNRVDYARWATRSADLEQLDAAIAAYALMTPSRMPREEAFAYWANLYNAITLQVVLSRYPVASIRDIRSEGAPLDPRAYMGPWRTKRVTVEGRRLSLDDIEHQILRPLVRDPRVHYAVNCASIGCPNLRQAAWRADTLDQELDRAARAFVNHPRAVTGHAGGGLRVSSIYVWFKEDFDGSDAGVIAHLRRHATPEMAQRLVAARRIASHHYDWSINAA